MPRILTHSEFLTIRRRLAAGRRHTEIARELGLSIWTIAHIADRRRYLPEVASDSDVPAAELLEDDSPPDYVAQNLRRCPECGAMVYLWPCIACSQGVATPAIAPPLQDEDDDELPSIFADQPASSVSQRISWDPRHQRARGFDQTSSSTTAPPSNKAPSGATIARGSSMPCTTDQMVAGGPAMYAGIAISPAKAAPSSETANTNIR